MSEGIHRPASSPLRCHPSAAGSDPLPGHRWKGPSGIPIRNVLVSPVCIESAEIPARLRPRPAGAEGREGHNIRHQSSLARFRSLPGVIPKYYRQLREFEAHIARSADSTVGAVIRAPPCPRRCSGCWGKLRRLADCSGRMCLPARGGWSPRASWRGWAG